MRHNWHWRRIDCGTRRVPESQRYNLRPLQPDSQRDRSRCIRCKWRLSEEAEYAVAQLNGNMVRSKFTIFSGCLQYFDREANIPFVHEKIFSNEAFFAVFFKVSARETAFVSAVDFLKFRLVSVITLRSGTKTRNLSRIRIHHRKYSHSLEAWGYKIICAGSWINHRKSRVWAKRTSFSNRVYEFDVFATVYMITRPLPPATLQFIFRRCVWRPIAFNRRLFVLVAVKRDANSIKNSQRTAQVSIDSKKRYLESYLKILCCRGRYTISWSVMHDYILLWSVVSI